MTMQNKQSTINIPKLLESLSTEEVSEQVYHRHALRRALLGSRYFDKQKAKINLKMLAHFTSPVLLGSTILVFAMFLQTDVQTISPVNAMSVVAAPISFTASEVNMSKEYHFETTQIDEVSFANAKQVNDQNIFHHQEDSFFPSFEQNLLLWPKNIVGYTPSFAN